MSSSAHSWAGVGRSFSSYVLRKVISVTETITWSSRRLYPSNFIGPRSAFIYSLVGHTVTCHLSSHARMRGARRRSRILARSSARYCRSRKGASGASPNLAIISSQTAVASQWMGAREGIHPPLRPPHGGVVLCSDSSFVLADGIHRHARQHGRANTGALGGSTRRGRWR
jgi:hypothetical protein